MGRVDLVAPNGPHMGGGTPLHMATFTWPRSIGHDAFEATDLDASCVRLHAAGVPVVLGDAVDGVAGLRVNAVHPSHCGFLVEPG